MALLVISSPSPTLHFLVRAVIQRASIQDPRNCVVSMLCISTHDFTSISIYPAPKAATEHTPYLHIHTKSFDLFQIKPRQWHTMSIGIKKKKKQHNKTTTTATTTTASSIHHPPSDSGLAPVLLRLRLVAAKGGATKLEAARHQAIGASDDSPWNRFSGFVFWKYKEHKPC